MTSLADRLRARLFARLDPARREWLDSALAAAAAGDHTPTAWTLAPKHLGREPLALDADEQRLLADVAPGVVFDRWTIVDAARALLLLALADCVADAAFAATVTEWYEQGDASEQQSWLRALPLLPQPERFLTPAIDACRTNIVPLFEAIACDNPYPERYFPTPQFNQLVLKTVFVGLPLARVMGLARRRNAELSRMTADFAAERRAAGRLVPADLYLAVQETSPAESH